MARSIRRDRSEHVRRSGRGRRLVWPVLVSVFFVGVLFVAVFPTQTYLNQKTEADQLRAELDEIDAHNEELRQRAEDLEDPAAIELIARAEFGLVFPGEESYVIVPGGGEPVEVPNAWPFERLEERLDD